MNKKTLAEVIVSMVNHDKSGYINSRIQLLLIRFEQSLTNDIIIDLMKQQNERNNNEDK